MTITAIQTHSTLNDGLESQFRKSWEDYIRGRANLTELSLGDMLHQPVDKTQYRQRLELTGSSFVIVFEQKTDSTGFIAVVRQAHQSTMRRPSASTGHLVYRHAYRTAPSAPLSYGPIRMCHRFLRTRSIFR